MTNSINSHQASTILLNKNIQQNTANPWETVLQDLYSLMTKSNLENPKTRDKILVELNAIKTFVDGQKATKFTQDFDNLYNAYTKFYANPTDSKLETAVITAGSQLENDKDIPATPSTPLSQDYKNEILNLIQHVLLPILSINPEDSDQFTGAFTILNTFGKLLDNGVIENNIAMISSDYNMYITGHPPQETFLLAAEAAAISACQGLIHP